MNGEMKNYSSHKRFSIDVERVYIYLLFVCQCPPLRGRSQSVSTTGSRKIVMPALQADKDSEDVTTDTTNQHDMDRFKVKHHNRTQHFTLHNPYNATQPNVPRNTSRQGLGLYPVVTANCPLFWVPPSHRSSCHLY